MNNAFEQSHPLVSVIIPAYNSARTIRTTLSSLDAQQFRDFETIVIDDGSTDETVAIVQREFPAVRVISQANAGPSAARNRGVAAARGIWLAFLDADDQFLPWRLSEQLDFARRFPQVDVWCGLPIGVDDPLPPLPAEVPQTVFCLKDFQIRNPVCMCTSLVRTALLRELGGFDERFRRAEDYLFWVRVAAVGTIARLEIPLCRYFEGTGTLSMDDRKFLPEALQITQQLYGPTGELRSVGRPAVARAYLYFSCSWMAYHRGDVKAALSLLLRSFVTWPFPLPLPDKPLAIRFRRLYRYLRFHPT